MAGWSACNAESTGSTLGRDSYCVGDLEQVSHSELLCSAIANCAVEAWALLSFISERKKGVRKFSINNIPRMDGPEQRLPIINAVDFVTTADYT